MRCINRINRVLEKSFAFAFPIAIIFKIAFNSMYAIELLFPSSLIIVFHRGYLILPYSTLHLSFNLIDWNIIRIFANDGFSNLPNLDQVIFCGTANNPGITRVPAEVREMVSVTSMHEEPDQR
jgi:hypothetical protein